MKMTQVLKWGSREGKVRIERWMYVIDNVIYKALLKLKRGGEKPKKMLAILRFS